MKKVAAILGGAALLALGLVAAAIAGGDYGHPSTISTIISTITNTTGGGHTPVTICHKPGTPAEMTLVVDDDAVPGHLGHGDYLGECQTETTPTDTNPTTPTETIPTTPTETTPTTPQQPPGTPHDCVYTGAGKDGQPGNNDCAELPKTTTTPPAKPGTAAVTPPPVAVVIVPPVKVKPKPTAPVRKPTAKPKPKPPVKHKTPKPDKPPTVKVKHVCVTLADGTKRVWYKGKGTIKPGCYAVVEGSG